MRVDGHWGVSLLGLRGPSYGQKCSGGEQVVAPRGPCVEESCSQPPSVSNELLFGWTTAQQLCVSCALLSSCVCPAPCPVLPICRLPSHTHSHTDIHGHPTGIPDPPHTCPLTLGHRCPPQHVPQPLLTHSLHAGWLGSCLILGPYRVILFLLELLVPHPTPFSSLLLLMDHLAFHCSL